MSDHTMDEQYVTELLTRLGASRKAQQEAEFVAANQTSELTTIAAALGDHRMSHNQVVDKIWFMNAKMADLDRLQAAARDALAEPEADDKRLAEGLGTVAWLLRFLVQDSPQPRGLLQAAKDVAKLQKDQQNKTVELLQAMVPYFVEDKPSAALEAWRAAGRRSALFQKTGQELGLTDSASPEQILQRAQEVAMILRNRERSNDFETELLAILGLPAPSSRYAVLDAVRELVARREPSKFQDSPATLTLSELPVGAKCKATATIRSINRRTAFGAWTPFTIKEIAVDKSSVFISHDRREVGFWVDPVQPAILASTIKGESTFPSDERIRAHRWWQRTGPSGTRAVELAFDQNGNLLDDSGDGPPLVLRAANGKEAASFPSYLADRWELASPAMHSEEGRCPCLESWPPS